MRRRRGRGIRTIIYMRHNYRYKFTALLLVILMTAGCGRGGRDAGDKAGKVGGGSASTVSSESSFSAVISGAEEIASMSADSYTESIDDVLIADTDGPVYAETQPFEGDDVSDVLADDGSREEARSGDGDEREGSVLVDDGEDDSPAGSERAYDPVNDTEDEGHDLAETFADDDGFDSSAGDDAKTVADDTDEDGILTVDDEDEGHVTVPDDLPDDRPAPAPQKPSAGQQGGKKKPSEGGSASGGTSAEDEVITVSEDGVTDEDDYSDVLIDVPEAEEEDSDKPGANAGGAAAGDAAEPSGDDADSGEDGSESTGDAAEASDLGEHLKGLRDFSVIEGMRPDVLSGVVWDDEVESVQADENSVDWDQAGTQTLRYLITGVDGSQAIREISVFIKKDLDHYLFGMEGDAIVEKGGSFDPMAGVSYGDEIASVTADTSGLDTSRTGVYLVTYSLTDHSGRSQSTVRQVTVSDGSHSGFEDNTAASFGSYSEVRDLGLWRLTAYMDTPADQGPYVGQTASGAPLVAGRTVAVSSATCQRLGLAFGDHLLIDGHIYVLEDHGDGYMSNQNWVDIFVDNPADEYSEKYNRFTEVYLLR